MGNFFKDLGSFVAPALPFIGAAIGTVLAGPGLGTALGTGLGAAAASGAGRSSTTGLGPVTGGAAAPIFAPPGVNIPVPGGVNCMVVPISERAEHLESLTDGFLESVTPWNTTHDIICTPPQGVVGAGVRRGVVPVGFFADLLLDPLAGMRVGSLIDIPPPTAVKRSERGAPGGVLWSAITKRQHRRARFPSGCPSRGFLEAFTAGSCTPRRPAICFAC